MTLFTGLGVALITPFNEKNEINFEKLRELLEFHIANKTDAVIVTGTTGESSTMSDEEKLAVIKFSVETVNKRIPVIAANRIKQYTARSGNEQESRRTWCRRASCSNTLL